MANTLRIKRRASGGAAGAPASMANAELAFNEQDNTLYYGWGTGGAGGTATQALAIGGPGAFQALDADLTAIAALGDSGAVTGFPVRTAANTWALRSLTAPAAGITITNPEGVAGNPTLALANDLAALEGLSTTGLIARTADGAAATRTITGTAGNVTVSNGSGVSGNPTIDLAAVSVTSGSVSSTFNLIEDVTVDSYGRVTAVTSISLSDISLDQFKVPQANLDINAKRLTNLMDPVNPQDAATKAYVDAARAGLDVKDSCRVATTANVDLAAQLTTVSIDGVSLAVGNRVLVKDQTTASQNGIYVVTSLTGTGPTWARAADFDSSAEVTAGAFTFVAEGSTQSDSGWVLTTNDTITLGTTALAFTQFSGAGQITAGAGLTKTGNTLDVVGTANRITVNADSIDIASTYAGQTSIVTLGTIATGTWQATAIGVAYGGTGLTSYTIGDLIYASGATTLAKLADVATGSALISGGVGVAPSWGKIGLTTHVSGTLPIANGGTNSTATPTLGGVSYGTGSAFAFTAAGTAGQALVSNGGAAPTWQTLTLANLPDAWTKKAVKVATTANITLSGTQTIDGIAVAAGDRVLVKNQTTQAENGIYVAAASAWSRAADANTASYLAGAQVSVDQGTANGGYTFTTGFKSTDTLGTTAVTWNLNYDSRQAKLANLLATTFADNQIIRFTSATAMEAVTVSDYMVTLFDDTDAAMARGTLGLGTIATQASSNVSITGGSITNLTTFDGVTLDCGTF